MATRKTKNAKNAAEYIDSAGVKLNANSDLIIEATKEGDVISARNLLNGNEYVGGGSGGLYIVKVINNALDHTARQILDKVNSGYSICILQEGLEDGTTSVYAFPSEIIYATTGSLAVYIKSVVSGENVYATQNSMDDYPTKVS